MIEAVTKGLSGYRAAARKLHEGVDRLRDVRLRLIEERTALVRTPGDRDEAIQALDAGLDALAAEAVATMSATGLTATGGGKLPAFDPFPDIQFARPEAIGAEITRLRRLALGFAAMADRDGMRAALTERLIDARIAGAKTASVAKKRADLAALDADLLAAEMAEESLIRSAEASGIEITRRRDADPRAVLAADAALPSQ